ncbi:MAG: hypothetical protein ABH804_00300 [archaeon]
MGSIDDCAETLTPEERERHKDLIKECKKREKVLDEVLEVYERVLKISSISSKHYKNTNKYLH